MEKIEVSDETLEDLKALYTEGETYDFQIRRLIRERSEAICSQANLRTRIEQLKEKLEAGRWKF